MDRDRAAGDPVSFQLPPSEAQTSLLLQQRIIFFPTVHLLFKNGKPQVLPRLISSCPQCSALASHMELNDLHSTRQDNASAHISPAFSSQ